MELSILKIAGFAMIAAFIAVVVRAYKPQYSIFVTVAACVCVLALALSEFSGIKGLIDSTLNEYGLNAEYIKVVFKAIGVGYIAQFASDTCKDANETSLAGKIELFGRLLILSLAVPIVIDILNSIKGMIPA